MNPLVLTNDLMFASRIEARAASLGHPVRILSNGEAAIDYARASRTRLVLVDLDHPVDLEAVVSGLKGLDPPPRIAAFGAHVRPQRLDDATRAGCDEVFTRGQFDARLPELMARWISAADQ